MENVFNEKDFGNLYSMLRHITDNVPDLLWSKDLEGRFTFVNKATCEFLLNAHKPEEVIGKTGMYFAKKERAKHPENNEWYTFGEICVDSDKIVLETGEPGRFDEYGNVSGKYLCLEVLKVPLFDDNGKLIGIVGSARDVTEQKRIEKRLEDLLQQTEADAKADVETKEILLREINHRVKNNLSSFIGMLYAEKKQSRRNLNEAQMEHVDSLINRVKGISIAHELLSRSRWAPISLFTLSEKIVHSLNHLIPVDRFIKTKITPSAVSLDTDQTHSMAVVINELFSNCIKHAAGAGEETEVSIEIKEKKGKITYIYSDNGPGFPEEVLNSESYNVGLYLVKNIVRQNLMGTVKIENKDGARVIIQFPGGVKFEEL